MNTEARHGGDTVDINELGETGIRHRVELLTDTSSPTRRFVDDRIGFFDELTPGQGLNFVGVALDGSVLVFQRRGTEYLGVVGRPTALSGHPSGDLQEVRFAFDTREDKTALRIREFRGSGVTVNLSEQLGGALHLPQTQGDWLPEDGYPYPKNEAAALGTTIFVSTDALREAKALF